MLASSATHIIGKTTVEPQTITSYSTKIIDFGRNIESKILGIPYKFGNVTRRQFNYNKVRNTDSSNNMLMA